MSTTAKASEHIKPCNIAQSERHNRRDADYIASLNPTKLYIREELSHLNESYIAPGMKGISLQQHFDNIRIMVKQKTGRAMQEKDVEFINKKGKKHIRRGCSPIREGVVNIKSDTTMEDLLRYVERVHERWGIKAIQIHLHKDEGHYENPEDNSTWQPNLHAHIIWDWMNHKTGKSFKLNGDDMSAMQDMVAETLDMERGQKKSETGIYHLERNDFIIQKQENKKKRLQKETEKVLLTLEAYTKAANVKEENLVVPVLRTNPLVKKAIMAIEEELNKPIPPFGQKEWRNERKIAVKKILTDLQTELLQAKKEQQEDILKMGRSLYKKAMKNVQTIIKQNKQLQEENGRLTTENTKLKDKISRIDETAINNLRRQKDEEIKELQIQLGKAEIEAVHSEKMASRERKRADDAEKQLQDMVSIPEIKELWDTIWRNKKAFWQQIDRWIDNAKATIVQYAKQRGQHDFPQESKEAIGMGIIAEAFKLNLDVTDGSQRMKATKDLLRQVSWTDTTEFMSNFATTRTKQLSDEITIPKELMKDLLLAAGGRSGVYTGGGGSNNELTNWDGTKKRNGWGR